jgi:lysophospholipase L1-like esterase
MLLLLEAGSWLWGRVDYPPQPLIARDHPAWAARRRYDPLLFWSLQPNRQHELGGTNSLGLRGPEVAPAKPPGEFRVLSLGESTTYGWRIPYTDCYSALLEVELRSRSSRPVRVINAGVPGYSVMQGWLYLQDRGLRLQPDAVLLYFGINDFLPIAFRERRDGGSGDPVAGLTDRELYLERRRPSARLLGWILEWSNLVRGLGALFADDAPPVTAEAAVERVDGAPYRVRVPEADRWSALSAIRNLCADAGIDLVVVIPWYRDFEGHAALLRRFAAGHGLPVVDLPAELAATPRPRSAYFQDPVHPNREGQQIIAVEILDLVEQRWPR